MDHSVTGALDPSGSSNWPCHSYAIVDLRPRAPHMRSDLLDLINPCYTWYSLNSCVILRLVLNGYRGITRPYNRKPRYTLDCFGFNQAHYGLLDLLRIAVSLHGCKYSHGLTERFVWAT